MAKKDTASTNANIKIDGSHNNIHVGHNQPSEKKEKKPHWLKRIVIGGIVTTLLSVGGYYLKKQIDSKNSVDPTHRQSGTPPVVETTNK